MKNFFLKMKRYKKNSEGNKIHTSYNHSSRKNKMMNSITRWTGWKIFIWNKRKIKNAFDLSEKEIQVEKHKEMIRSKLIPK
jgi:hypothetical protein